MILCPFCNGEILNMWGSAICRKCDAKYVKGMWKQGLIPLKKQLLPRITWIPTTYPDMAEQLMTLVNILNSKNLSKNEAEKTTRALREIQQNIDESY